MWMNSSGRSLGTAWMPHYWHSPPPRALTSSSPSPTPLWGISGPLDLLPGRSGLHIFLPSQPLTQASKTVLSRASLFLQPHLSVPLGNNKGHNPAPNLGLPPSTGAPGCLLLRTQPTASFPPGHLPWATSPSWTAPPLWSWPVFLFLCNPHWIQAQKGPDGTDLIHQIPMAWDMQLMTDKYWPSERVNKSFSTILGTSCCNLRKQVMPLKNPMVTDCLMMH